MDNDWSAHTLEISQQKPLKKWWLEDNPFLLGYFFTFQGRAVKLVKLHPFSLMVVEPTHLKKYYIANWIISPWFGMKIKNI